MSGKGKKRAAPPPDAFVMLCRRFLRWECVREYRFHPERRWRFDYAFPEVKVALEVEGGVWTRGRHVSPQGFLNDMEKYNAAARLGWRLLRTTPAGLLTMETLRAISETASQAPTPGATTP